MTELPDRPGVVALPPLIYLAALVAALLTHWALPLALPLPAFVRWAGGLLALSAIALAFRARAEFTRAGTNPNPMLPATALVRSGPFRFTRNPMYLGMAATFMGLALLTRIGWFLIVLPPWLALMHWGVVLREERYMSRKFGADYEAYRAATRRYL